MSAPSCRTCQHSTMSGDALVCKVRTSPAWNLEPHAYYGVCARASRSRAENAQYDRRCAALAASCEHFTRES